eukprot:10691765-Karenia_brevis.AAC.1
MADALATTGAAIHELDAVYANRIRNSIDLAGNVQLMMVAILQARATAGRSCHEEEVIEIASSDTDQDEPTVMEISDSDAAANVVQVSSDDDSSEDACSLFS